MYVCMHDNIAIICIHTSNIIRCFLVHIYIVRVTKKAWDTEQMRKSEACGVLDRWHVMSEKEE